MDAAIRAGSGRHLITLTLDQIESFLKVCSPALYSVDVASQMLTPSLQADEASQLIFPSAITTIKLSILLFYRRLFPSPTFQRVALTIAFINILWWFGSLLTAFLHCRPFAYYWNKSIVHGHCANDNVVGYSVTATELVTDLIVLVLPIPWLLRLKLTPSQRVGVIGLFFLGSL